MRSRGGSRHGCRCGRLLAICGKVSLQGAGLSGLPSGSGGNPREVTDCSGRSMRGPGDGRGCCEMVFRCWGGGGQGAWSHRLSTNCANCRLTFARLPTARRSWRMESELLCFRCSLSSFITQSSSSAVASSVLLSARCASAYVVEDLNSL